MVLLLTEVDVSFNLFLVSLFESKMYLIGRERRANVKTNVKMTRIRLYFPVFLTSVPIPLSPTKAAKIVRTPKVRA